MKLQHKRAAGIKRGMKKEKNMNLISSFVAI